MIDKDLENKIQAGFPCKNVIEPKKPELYCAKVVA